jgi:hypothetical protein
MVGPSDGSPFRLQRSRVEAELEVSEDWNMIAPGTTTSARRRDEDGGPANDARGGQDVIEKRKFCSRVPAFAAGEEALAECGLRASLEQSIGEAQVLAPVSELLNGGGQQVLGGREMGSGDNTQVA